MSARLEKTDEEDVEDLEDMVDEKPKHFKEQFDDEDVLLVLSSSSAFWLALSSAWLSCSHPGCAGTSAFML
jgi:hypothetical protein